MAIQTISREELKRKLEQGDNVEIVDVLPPETYAQGVIKGSLKIPLKELEKRYEELDAKQEIVTYCAGPSCSASRQAAEYLAKKGFQVRAYEGGLEKWKEAGLPLEVGAPVEALEQPSGLSGVVEPVSSRER
jgi:rhodanese-related sulfurtransferase